MIALDKATNHYAVFGCPVKHSQSPRIHTLFAAQTGIKLDYQAIEVSPDRFTESVTAFLQDSGKGLNITVPFKEAAYAMCTNLTKRAQFAASVNTLWLDGQSNICGDTTDGEGLIRDLTVNNQINIANQSVLILGAGGAVRAIIGPLCAQKPKHIAIANRTVSRARQLAKKVSDKISIMACSYDDLDDSFDLIINGTALSLAGALPPLAKVRLNKQACCYDLMYGAQPTCFMTWAQTQGATTILDGLGMLVEQAAASFFIWHGQMPDPTPVIAALRK